MTRLSSIRRARTGGLGIAAALALSMQAATAGTPMVLDQGWSAEMRDMYYFTPQGSRLMPYDWFLALEKADGSGLLSSPDSMDTYGWLRPVRPNPDLNPDDLPVGFVKDPADDPAFGPAVGMTCAACHTGDLTYEGTTVRIDGAPSQADFNAFLADLADAVDRTLFDKAAFGRFAARVFGRAPTAEEAAGLHAEFALFAAEFAGTARIRTPTVGAGPGRVDALSQIVNSLAVQDLGIPENLRAPDAPVSYPHIWLSSHQDWVQWNPVASSPIARNLGELLGVFGTADLTGARDGMFATSALLPRIHALETWVADLNPPVWPADVLGPIDAGLAATGKALYARDCLACHTMPPFELTPKDQNIVGKQFIKTARVDYREVGTDPEYTRAMVERVALTGDLGPVLFDGKPVVPAARLFTSTVGAVLRSEMKRLGIPEKDQLAYNDYRFSPPAAAGEAPRPWLPPSLTDLKGGPLLGIWATGPFLHNGSVPNVYELLSPPEERSAEFWVGGVELDPVRLGFRSTAQDLDEAERSRLFRFDTTVPANGNGGHAYPATPYTHEERMAVIEYLKSATLADAP